MLCVVGLGIAGLIILGKAKITGGGTSNIEGLPAGPKSLYGGTDNTDNSGTLKFVRVWYGGRDINPSAAEPGQNSGNEINGTASKTMILLVPIVVSGGEQRRMTLV